MKMSVMVFPFHKELSDKTLSAKKFVEDMKNVGVTALEPMLSWVDSDPAGWNELRKAAADAGMQYSCFDIGANFVGENAEDRRKAFDNVARGVEWCVQVKCPVALLPGSRPATGMSNEEGRKIYSEGLAKSFDMTKGSGVTLTIEDFGVYPHFACHSTHCIEVLDGAKRPALKFTFDNGNFILADEQPADALKRTQDRIVHVHIKDFALRPPDDKPGLTTPAGKKYMGCEIGAGVTQVKECLALIKASRYSGWISLEVGTRPPLDSAIQGAKYVTEAWKKV
jgi:sugar phosphate isomerase/epimerase